MDSQMPNGKPKQQSIFENEKSTFVSSSTVTNTTLPSPLLKGSGTHVTMREY